MASDAYTVIDMAGRVIKKNLPLNSALELVLSKGRKINMISRNGKLIVMRSKIDFGIIQLMARVWVVVTKPSGAMQFTVLSTIEPVTSTNFNDAVAKIGQQFIKRWYTYTDLTIIQQKGWISSWTKEDRANLKQQLAEVVAEKVL